MRWNKRIAGGSVLLAGLALGGAVIVSSGSPELVTTDRTPTAATCAISVDGMTCAGCAVAVKMAAGRVDGVTSVEVNLEHRQAHVTFDPAKTTSFAIARAIADGTGFSAEPQAAFPN